MNLLIYALMITNANQYKRAVFMRVIKLLPLLHDDLQQLMYNTISSPSNLSVNGNFWTRLLANCFGTSERRLKNTLLQLPLLQVTIRIVQFVKHDEESGA